MPYLLQQPYEGNSKSDARNRNRELDKLQLTPEDMADLLSIGGIDASTLSATNTYRLGGSTDVRRDSDRYFNFNKDTQGSPFSNTVSFAATTGMTSAGTTFNIPAYEAFVDMGKVIPNASYFDNLAPTSARPSIYYGPEMTALESHNQGFQEYLNFVAGVRSEAEQADNEAALGSQAATFQNIVDRSAADTETFIDEETISPEETGQFFDDLGVVTDGGDFYGPGVSATQQQSALDAYGLENVGTDAGELDATVQGQVQIRNDITGLESSINKNTVDMALTVLAGMGADVNNLETATVNLGGVDYTYYRDINGNDVTALVQSVSETIQQKIDDSSAAQMTALGYGGKDQPTLFSDLAAIKSAVDAGPDLSGVQTLSQEDISGALASQFGTLSGEISDVSGQVTGVQETVDTVQEAVGTLDERQVQMVEDLRLLGVDTDAIITAVEGVQAAVDLVPGQITSAAQGVRQDIATQGGSVADLFGAQTEALGGGASAAAVQQVAGNIEGLKSAQKAQTETLGDLATAEGQAAVKQLVENVKTSASAIDTAIKDNVLPEFEEIFEIFDGQGKLIGEINTETGKIVSSVAPNGDVIVDTLTAIDTAVDTGFGGIDLSNLDESEALTTLTNSIDNAASIFTTDYSSMETNIDNDRVAVLKAIQEDSTALDNFLSTKLPTVITTEFGDYELKVGENNEALVTKIAADTATAVDFNQADLVSALSDADAYDEAALISAIGFDPAEASETARDAESARVAGIQARDKAQTLISRNLADRKTTEAFTATINKIQAGDIATLGQLDASAVTAIEQAVGYNEGDLTSAIRTGVTTDIDLNALNDLSTQEISDAIEGSTLRTSLTDVAADAEDARSYSIWANNKSQRIETIANELKGDEAAITALINGQTTTIQGETLKLDQQNQLIIEDTEGIEGLPGTIETNLGVRFDNVDSAVNGLENLDSSAITAAVEASAITSTLSGVATDAAAGKKAAQQAASRASSVSAKIDTQTGMLKTDRTTTANFVATIDKIKAGDIATLGQLDSGTITAIENAIDYDAGQLESDIKNGLATSSDVSGLENLSSVEVANLISNSQVAKDAGFAAADAAEAKTKAAEVITKLSTGDIAGLGDLDSATISAIEQAVGYNAGALESAIRTGVTTDLDLDSLNNLSTTEVENIILNSQLSADAATAATEAASAKDQASWARGRIQTVQEKLIPNLSSLLTTETGALDDLIDGQTKQIGENFVEIDKDLGLIITDTTGIETNLGKLDTSSVQSAVDSLNNLDSAAITAAVNASDLSTLKASDVTGAVDLTTIESTVADIKAGNIATLGELDDSEITALANAVNYDPVSLLSSIEASSLNAKDLEALSTLTSQDITDAVDLSGLSTLTAGEVKTAVDYDSTALTNDFKKAVGDSEQALTALAGRNVATIQGSIGTYQLAVTGEGELLVTAFDNLTGEVRTVDSKVGNLDLTALGDIGSIKTTVEALPAEALDISGLATSAQVGQVGTAVQGQAVSLGNIDNIKSDVTTLLSKAEQDLQNNTERDKQIEASRLDVLEAVSNTLSSNKDAMSLLLGQQTIDIQGNLGDYRVGLDSATGKLTAEAINRQTLSLGGQIDTATGQLKTDAKTNTNFLEQQVLNARDAVNNKVGTAFDAEGKLIADSVAANGDEIKRVLDAEGVLTETIIDTKGIVTDTIKTDLSALIDDTGRLNETALAIASDTGGIESLQKLFDAQGKLVREDIDELGRDVIREIDRSGRFVNEAYYQDGYLVEEKQLRIDKIFKKLFPTDPLAQPEELTAADRRFLQGFRTEGLMSPYQ